MDSSLADLNQVLMELIRVNLKRENSPDWHLPQSLEQQMASLDYGSIEPKTRLSCFEEEQSVVVGHGMSPVRDAAQNID